MIAGSGRSVRLPSSYETKMRTQQSRQRLARQRRSSRATVVFGAVLTSRARGAEPVQCLAQQAIEGDLLPRRLASQLLERSPDLSFAKAEVAQGGDRVVDEPAWIGPSPSISPNGKVWERFRIFCTTSRAGPSKPLGKLTILRRTEDGEPG